MRVVDLFAGWGGASLGAEQAGAEVLLAANHWPLAVEAHTLNHPDTKHLCQDLNQANFSMFPDHDVLWASPACQGSSQAARPARKFDLNMKQKHDALRSTAWAVINALEAKQPSVAFIENVTDFKRWQLYPMWKMCIEHLGYAVEEHFPVATSFGVPQRRKRMVIVASRSTAPMGLRLPAVQEIGFGPFIDWNDEHVDVGEQGWAPVSSKPINVQARVHRARAQGRGEVFLTQYVTNHPGVPLHEPIRTITTKAQWALVCGGQIRMLRVRELARAMGFPDSYQWPASSKEEQIKGLGNAVAPPMARWFIERAMEAA